MGKGSLALSAAVLGLLVALWVGLFASSSVAAIIMGSSLLLASLLLAWPSTKGVTTGLIHFALKCGVIVPLFVIGLAFVLNGAVSGFAAAMVLTVAATFCGVVLLGLAFIGGLYARQRKAALKQRIAKLKESVANGGATGGESLIDRITRLADLNLGTLGGVHSGDSRWSTETD